GGAAPGLAPNGAAEGRAGHEGPRAGASKSGTRGGAALGPAPINDAVLDGEIVALDGDGRSSFHRLQQRMNLAGEADITRAAAKIPVVYYAFDLLALQGRDLMPLPLVERKAKLAGLAWSEPWRYADDVAGDGIGLFRLAREHGLEGIVAKRADAPYRPGRSRDWLKLKIHQRQEAVIVGYTDPRGLRTEFGALAIAVYDTGRRALLPVGKVGTGFDAKTRAAIRRRLQPAGPARGGVHPVKPELVAEVQFAEWTPEGAMRAPVFLGLRPDKAPNQCVREVPHG
ncbi:MAG: non-homologous end-joining DNA ligase, partial [Terriglobales bacterium]